MMSASTSVPRSAAAPARPETRAETCPPASAAEKCFEEIAETCAAEFELHAAAIRASVTLEAAARLPARRPIREVVGIHRRLIPIRAQLIVFPPLLRIAQNFVGFVDLLEFLLRGRSCPWRRPDGYLRASLRKADRISLSVAVFETPSVS